MKVQQVVQSVLNQARYNASLADLGFPSKRVSSVLVSDLEALKLPQVFEKLEQRGKRLVEQEQEIRELKRKLARTTGELEERKKKPPMTMRLALPGFFGGIIEAQIN